MQIEEFRNKISFLGLDSLVMTRIEGFCDSPCIKGAFFRDGAWVVYENDSSGNHSVLLPAASEEDAFNFLYRLLLGIL